MFHAHINPRDETSTPAVWSIPTTIPRMRVGSEVGKAGTQDKESTRIKKGWHTHANPLDIPTNKDMELSKHVEDSKAKVAGKMTIKNNQEILQQLEHVLLVWV